MNLTLPGSFFVLFMLPAFVLVHVIIITFGCYGKTHEQINLQKSLLRLTASEGESMAVVVRACSRQSGRFQSSNYGFSSFPRAYIHPPSLHPYSPLHLLKAQPQLKASSNKATSPNFSQTVLSAEDQTFEYVYLYGHSHSNSSSVPNYKSEQRCCKRR